MLRRISNFNGLKRFTSKRVQSYTRKSYTRKTCSKNFLALANSKQRRWYSEKTANTESSEDATASTKPAGEQRNAPRKQNGSRKVLFPLAVLGGAALIIGYLYVKPALDPKKMRSRKAQLLRLENIFNKHASITTDAGERFMTREDFISSILLTKITPEEQHSIINRLLKTASFEKLFPIDGGQISFSEFVFFDALLSTPKDEFQVAFRMFDTSGTGEITKQEFTRLMRAIGHIKFSFASPYWESFFGTDGKGKISEATFLGLLNDLRKGLVTHEFAQFDKKGRGVISGQAFIDLIFTNTKTATLPKHIQTNLRTVGRAYQDASISFEDYENFYNFLDSLSSFGPALHKAKAGIGRRGISRGDFKRIAKITTGVDFSLTELDLLFHVFDNPNKHGMLDISAFIDAMHIRQNRRLFDIHQLDQAIKIRTPLEQIVIAIKSFGIGAVAGAIGATAVYPIDLVKTRMQNQRYSTIAGKSTGTQLYKNSIDCFLKVIKNEGPVGLYRGLIPQLIGVAPEKAIKLVVNDILRDLLKDPSNGNVGVPAQIIAGGSAGASQVVFTNPLEIIKIRLQVQGELAAQYGVKPKGAITVISELGFLGLYKGASACFMRDIPFSAIYFPAYTFFKHMRNDNPSKLTPWDLFVAGTAAGFFAASTTTPADVIKTRLQVEARKGDQTYSGIADCFWKILKSEGPLAFYKGVVPRVFRSAPQFGVTLLAYEMIQKFFDPEKNISPPPPTNAPVAPEDLPEDKEKMKQNWGLSTA